MPKLSFIKSNRVTVVDTSKLKINTESFYEGKVCGTSNQRSKEPKRKKYSLKPVFVDSPPLHYVHLYSYRRELVPCPQLKHDIGTDQTVKIVKKYKNIWELNKPKYFSWHNPPEMLQNILTPVANPVKKVVPFHNRPFKDFSKHTANKITSKLQMWYITELAKNNYNQDKVGFKFLTFTVTTPNFDHEKTVKAWANFLNNMKHLYGQKFQYLWVAELQTGKRSRDEAKRCFDLWQKNINPEINKKRYEEYTERGLNPTNNIHYHMVVDRYYNIEILNHLWSTCLGNQGAAVFNSDGVRFRPVQLPKKRYKLKSDGTKEFYDHQFTCESLVRYVAKYMTKQSSEDGTQGLRCALWHCSRMVSRFATSRYSHILDMNALLMEFGAKINRVGADNSIKHYVK